MTGRADVVIIGGGLVGTAIAYYLSKTGKKVILLERKSIGSGTSGLTFGLLCIQLFKYFGVVDSYLKICKTSLEMYMNLEEELGEDFQYRKTGGMVVIKDEEDFKHKSDLVRTLQAKNVEIEILDKEQTLEIAPALNPDGILGSSFSPIEAEINPLLLSDVFISKAKLHGAVVVSDAPVSSFSMKNGRVETIHTPKGPFSSDFVVNACGLWGSQVGKMAGLDLPLNVQRGQVLITEAMPPFLPVAVQHIPPALTDETGRHLVKSTEIRQMKNGNLLMGGTREDNQTETITTYESITDITRRAADFLPAVRRARIIRTFGGIRPIPKDGLPILGFTEEVAGWVNALMHVGVTLAPVVGKLTAELIDTGKTSLDITDFRMSRFGKEGTPA
ncbi:MAG: FAD-binding oxidoreductase [Thermodesulfobacteriota bacterium]